MPGRFGLAYCRIPPQVAFSEELMRARSVLLFTFLSIAAFASRNAVAQENHRHALTEEEVGSVRFSTSCSRAVENNFNRAVALLHSFQYEQVQQVFDEIAKQDPTCAMAQWGIAMSRFHSLWNNGDLIAGRAALQNAQELAQTNKSTTPREHGYIDALAEIYREDGKSQFAHDQAFEQKMGALQAAYPSDDEAAVFHALALDISAPPGDKTFANQRKCGEILEPIFARLPNHPGAAHYLIHCYDNPVLAEKGLGAARVYAKIAPASPHANHMPSHIFTRLGLWQESIVSNLRSKDLATEAERTSATGEARDQRLHAMDYLEYAYLQSGRVKQARAVLDEMESLKSINGATITGGYANAAIPARFAIELSNWNSASELKVGGGTPYIQAITWVAIGVGSARSGNLEKAASAGKTLAGLVDASSKLNDEYWAKQIEVQRREVAAWILEKQGRSADAIATLRSAAALEDSMEKDGVSPGPLTPAREMLAEMLALQDRPAESLKEYEAVLKVAPNRFNAVYGAARAAESAGNAEAARMYFRKLTEFAVGDERPELVAARKKVVTN
jgi:tetratricopeptide (TPR) repeat protein